MSARKRPRKVSVVLTRRAINDLLEVERYSIERWGREVAEKYLDEVAAALDRVSEHPDILRAEPSLVAGLFLYRVRKHCLICDDQGDSILVLTVIHASMDIPSRLIELEPGLMEESRFLQQKLRAKRGKQ